MSPAGRPRALEGRDPDRGEEPQGGKYKQKLGRVRVHLGDPFLRILVKIPAGLLWVIGSVAPGFSAHRQICVPRVECLVTRLLHLQMSLSLQPGLGQGLRTLEAFQSMTLLPLVCTLPVSPFILKINTARCCSRLWGYG